MLEAVTTTYYNLDGTVEKVRTYRLKHLQFKGDHLAGMHLYLTGTGIAPCDW